jgi:tetratricopeptide (TPR) repeat protein
MRHARWLILALGLIALSGLGSGCAHRPRDGAAPTGGALDSRSRRRDRLHAEEPEPELEQRVAAYTEYALAVSAELNDRQAEALDLFYRAALAQPTRQELVVQVVSRLLQAQQHDRAVEVILRATSLPTATGELFSWLGFAYAAQGKTELAIAANREAIRREPMLLLAYRNLTLLYSQARQPDLALEVLQEAARQPSADVPFLVAVAELYSGHARAHPDHAEAAQQGLVDTLDRAVALQPSDPLLRQRIADGYRLSGETDKAEAILLDLVQRYPELPLVRETLAEIYLRGGRKEAAAQQLEVITRERPANERASYFLGTLAFEDKKFAEAEQLFRRTLALRPDFEPAYYDLAGALLNQDRPSDALEVLNQAHQRFSKKFLIEFYMGLANVRAERYDAAVRHFTEAEVLARATEPQRLSHVFYFQFGAASERRGDHAQAEGYFRKCLELAPDFAEVMNYLGYMWAERGENLEEARALIAKALELEPDNAAYLDSMGWVLFRLKQPREALPWLEKAIERSGEPDATLYDHLGDVLAALGEWEEAREAWRKALAVKPDDAIRRKLDTGPPDGRPE